MGDDDISLFIVRWTRPQNDAIEPLLCEYCGKTLYSSTENIGVARQRVMRVSCLNCARGLIREHGSILGGRVLHGEVIEDERKLKIDPDGVL